MVRDLEKLWIEVVNVEKRVCVNLGKYNCDVLI